MDHHKSYPLMLEILLTLLFLTLWAGISSGRIYRMKSIPEHTGELFRPDSCISSEDLRILLVKACRELVPSFSSRDSKYEPGSVVPVARELLQKEMFPIQSYSMDYWSGAWAFQSSFSDTVPAYLLESDESNKETKKKDPGIMADTGKGKSYSIKKLSDRDYLLSHFYIVDETTSMSDEETDARKLLKKNLAVQLPQENPLVLIYHTHGSESYMEEDGKAGTVIDAGEALKKELEEKYQIPVIHDTTIYDMINGQLDRSLAYNYAAEGVSAILKKNPGIKVIIDLHRDSISENHRLTADINGTSAAKIMFFNGVSRRRGTGEIERLYNPNKLSNLAFSLQLQLLAARYYPGLTRKIYIKGYRYNLHLKKRAALIEVGAQNNTVTEAKNAMKPLAEILYRLLSGEKAYKS